MRVLVVYCHPVETSFNAAVHDAVVAALRAAGHEVDDCDLYAEGFDPVMGRDERIGYHDVPANRSPVAAYVDRLLAAEALVVVSPVWNYGFPAVLKGFFDRVFLPGVSFEMVDGKVAPRLANIRRLVAVMTYGGSRWRTMLVGDPPRKLITRGLRAVIHPFSKVRHLALYDMNRAGPRDRAAFLARVERTMRRL